MLRYMSMEVYLYLTLITAIYFGNFAKQTGRIGIRGHVLVR